MYEFIKKEVINHSIKALMTFINLPEGSFKEAGLFQMIT
jgi:hypothetical protein